MPRLWPRERRLGTVRRAPPRPRFELAPARRSSARLQLPHPRLKRVAIGLALTVALAAAGYGAWWVLLGDALRIHDVRVAGTQVAGPAAVAAAAAVGGRSLLTLDGGAVAARISALPEVRSTEVQRRWPHGVTITVTEHQGWGYWQAGSVRRVIDADGQPRERARPPAAGAPTIIAIAPTGPGATTTTAADTAAAPDADTVRLVERLLAGGAFERLHVTPAGFEFRRDRGLTMLVQGGPSVLFGDGQDYDFKLAAWGTLLEQIAGRRIEAQELDLRFGPQLVLR
ncbi:MAG: FtsQ-type POTRA domain-containing protein [Dehalococcoidia bacterium]|nr:FtsQ-type POTRA domain-containing protein [Dehalococcoidia bacterium]